MNLINLDKVDALCLLIKLMKKFWLDPPWQRYPQKYNLGLRPIKLKDWLASNPSDEILNHKKKLLSTNYERVVSTVNHPDNPEFILSNIFKLIQYIQILLLT